MSTTRPDYPKARATEARNLALVLCGHGARGKSAAAFLHADAVRRRAIFREVHACCLKGEPGLADTLSAVEAGHVHVAPFLMSHGRTWSTLRSSVLRRSRKRPPQLTLGPPVGLDPMVAEIITHRATQTCHGRAWRPDRTRLVLVAHGTWRDADARDAAAEHARCIRSNGIFRGVVEAFLSDTPSLAEALGRFDRGPSVVVGVFAEHGAHGTDDILDAIAPSSESVAYAGPIGDDPGFTEIVIRHALSAAGVQAAA